MKLEIHPHAQDDIRALLKRDVNGVGKLLALLQQITADLELIDQLNMRGRDFFLNDYSRANATGFASLRPQRDVWRLKAWDSQDRLIPYRVIYGFFPAGQHRRQPVIQVFAVVDRNQYNYEYDHPLTQRVINDYDDANG